MARPRQPGERGSAGRRTAQVVDREILIAFAAVLGAEGDPDVAAGQANERTIDAKRRGPAFIIVARSDASANGRYGRGIVRGSVTENIECRRAVGVRDRRRKARAVRNVDTVAPALLAPIGAAKLDPPRADRLLEAGRTADASHPSRVDGRAEIIREIIVHADLLPRPDRIDVEGVGHRHPHDAEILVERNFPIVALRSERACPEREAVRKVELERGIGAVDALARKEIARRAAVSRIASSSDELARSQRRPVLPGRNREGLPISRGDRPRHGEQRAVVRPTEWTQVFGRKIPVCCGKRVPLAELVGEHEMAAVPFSSE